MPLTGPTQGDNESPKMYQSKLGQAASSSMGHPHSWVNWKNALTFFALLNSPLPDEEELGALRVKLTEASSGESSQAVNKKEFCAVSYHLFCYLSFIPFLTYFNFFLSFRLNSGSINMKARQMRLCYRSGKRREQPGKSKKSTRAKMMKSRRASKSIKREYRRLKNCSSMFTEPQQARRSYPFLPS